MSGLSEYWAYYSGASALRVILTSAVKRAIEKTEPPKGRGGAKTMVCILGRTHTVEWPINVDGYLDSITHEQALEAVRGIPLKNPSGCDWRELWEAYKERYSPAV